MNERSVIMLHGLGGDQNTMGPIGKFCSQRIKNAHFISVEGPINLGDSKRPCRGWFEPPDDSDRSIDGNNPPRLNGLESSLELVHASIDKLVAKGVAPSKIHLLGHSQGGAIAIAAGLTYAETVGSVCTIAGYLALTPDMKPRRNGTRYFLHHSEFDDNVGYRWAEYARSFIEKNGNQCVVRAWDIRQDPHAIHQHQLDEICEIISDDESPTF